MRRLALLATLSVTAIVASPRPASAAEAKGPWEGFGVGSYVHQKQTSTVTGVPGMPAMPPQVNETKQTLVKITDDAWTVKHESKAGDGWKSGIEMRIPRKGIGTPPKTEDLGEEKVTVEGQEFTCRKERIVMGGIATVVWTNATHGLLKNESTGPGMTSVTIVTKLAAKTTIAGVEIVYRESVTTSNAGGADSKVTSWTSDAVPGGAVRSEMSAKMAGGMTTSSVTETVAFEKK